MRNTQIAICFFGITRSLKHTIGSIEANVIEPARALGTVRTYAHFFDQASISNSRSGEQGELDREEYRLLKADRLRLEAPDMCLEEWGFEGLKDFGDSWNDGFRSLRNLVHQLHSMNAAAADALADDPDLVIYCRPDMLYHHNLGPWIGRALASSEPGVTLPNWQHWHGGYNDRFAICRGVSAARIYGSRVNRMRDFCVETSSPVHSERLLRFVLDEAGIKPPLMSARASRVRANGDVKRERFSGPVRSALRLGIGKTITAAGLRPLLMRLRRNNNAR
ncbi:hypothetical protein [Celeribacter indicus]|uniref:Uncharacterized protein n=1 Tax=Celeribacter indicus TaxID=1208324 RepID=A0A0B5E1A1_9RHOB|nr:hypothetical protein [Celeribacter indicus]AJE47160.1 hypothetical protein P73_2445 [Celeribacter indicus]SDX58929.1 hypothetical protein SAMN05443573_1477 [Celeribacter indicus]